MKKYIEHSSKIYSIYEFDVKIIPTKGNFEYYYKNLNKDKVIFAGHDTTYGYKNYNNVDITNYGELKIYKDLGYNVTVENFYVHYMGYGSENKNIYGKGVVLAKCTKGEETLYIFMYNNIYVESVRNNEELFLKEIESGNFKFGEIIKKSIYTNEVFNAQEFEQEDVLNNNNYSLEK